MILRPYQEQCVQAIEDAGSGAWLIAMGTGLGKTVVFAHIPRFGRTLIISHRQELVHQPLKYFDCVCTIEQGKNKADPSAPVVSASIQSLVRRLDRYSPDAFDTIVVDEAHHAAATSYRTILDYFKPRRILGFTATPNRGDGVRLDNIFSEIIFDRDLRWGIENQYLSPLLCKRIDIGYNLTSVTTRAGDFAQNELEEACNITAANKAIAEIFQTHAAAPALIFAVSVQHAVDIAKEIPGAVALSGKSKNRDAQVAAFKAGAMSALVNCKLFTEGTDLPNVRSVIVARPTQSITDYTQMVGRGTRLHPGKDKCILIDCVGVSRHNLCTAPSLLGNDLQTIAPEDRADLEGDLLMQLPALIAKKADTPNAWIRNVEIVDLWAKQSHHNLHDVRYFRYPDGRMRVSLPQTNGARGSRWIEISTPDLRTHAQVSSWRGGLTEPMPLQKCLDLVHRTLVAQADDQHVLWSKSSFKRWGSQPASDGQLRALSRRLPRFDSSSLTKGQASLVLDRIFAA